VSPALLALPILSVALATLVLRRTMLESAALGAVLAALLFVLSSTASEPAGAVSVLSATVVLTLNAAAVIGPGIWFAETVARRGSSEAVGAWTRDWALPKHLKMPALILGLMPFLECMTGFGISMVATVPALLALLPRDRALKVALVGMSIAPWGTLGLATAVGAQLSNLELEQLGTASAMISFFVFPAAAAVSVWLAGRRDMLALGSALSAGVVFSFVLIFFNRAIGVQLAGSASGLVFLLVFLTLGWARGLRIGAPPRAIWPYAALFGLVLLVRLADAAFGLSSLYVIRVGNVSWAPLGSPGLSLAAAAVLAGGAEGPVLAKALHRAYRPILTLGLFLLMSQLMVAGGIASQLASSLSGISSSLSVILVAAAGAASGYLTGSNLGGNALAMPAASSLGASQGVQLLFSAVQNSAAGHAIIGSIPIITILLGLAQGRREEEAVLLRFGVVAVAANTALAALAALVWLMVASA